MTRKTRLIGDFRVEISAECVGSAQCVSMAPGVFELGLDGLATLTEDVLGKEAIEHAREAENVCPMAAIRVEAVVSERSTGSPHSDQGSPPAART